MTDADDNIDRSVESFSLSLVTRARNGDDSAWRRLERSYRRLICWWATKGGVATQDVEDVTQEVLAALAKSLPNYERGEFRAFLWGIARHKIRDYWRERRNEPPRGEADVEQLLASVEAESNRSEGTVGAATKLVFDSVVQLIKGEFSELDWQAFWKFAVEGRSAHEVANGLGISRNQVYLAKSRILRRIRAEFGADGRSADGAGAGTSGVGD